MLKGKSRGQQGAVCARLRLAPIRSLVFYYGGLRGDGCMGREAAQRQTAGASYALDLDDRRGRVMSEGDVTCLGGLLGTGSAGQPQPVSGCTVLCLFYFFSSGTLIALDMRS